MDQFLQFLKHSKESLKNLSSFDSIHIVLGNESCDLDSTVSSLALGYLTKSQSPSTLLVLPILNVDSKYFSLRTETCYLLSESNIDTNVLIFKEEIDFSNILNNTKVVTTIVDHHVLANDDKILAETVERIFDHRPVNSEAICKNKNRKQTIRPVGSCTTLIAKEIIETAPSLLFKELSYLLYATIIYDTIGLNKSCGKTTDEDVAVAEHLEKILQLQQCREKIFETLWKIHNDTTGLKTKDLLYRDLKIVQNIPIPGLPLLVEDYLKREDAKSAVQAFADEHQSPLVVLIGIDAASTVRRDIGVFFRDERSRDVLVEILQNTKELGLTQTNTNIDNVNCFRQSNIKLTRKFILPLVNEAAQKLSL